MDRAAAALLVAIGMLIFTHVTLASPVATYDFTATLDQPVDGSNQVSGSFSIFQTIPTTWSPGYPQPGQYWRNAFSQNENPNPFTLNFASHSLTETFNNWIDVWLVNPNAFPDSHGEQFSVNSNLTSNGKVVGDFHIVLSTSADDVFPTSGDQMPQLSLDKFSSSTIGVGISDLTQRDISGALTSLTFQGLSDPDSITPPSTVPEPTSIALFVVFGIVAIKRRRRADTD